MSNRYQLRPRPLTAVRWDGTRAHGERLAQQMTDVGHPAEWCPRPTPHVLHGEGNNVIHPGDWILHTVSGLWASMGHDQFTRQYEEAPDERNSQ